MKADWMKWVYSFVLLSVVCWWGAFCVETVKWAIANKAEADIIAAAGVSVMLGVLLAMLKDINQFWFRKSKPKE